MDSYYSSSLLPQGLQAFMGKKQAFGTRQLLEQLPFASEPGSMEETQKPQSDVCSQRSQQGKTISGEGKLKFGDERKTPEAKLVQDSTTEEDVTKEMERASLAMPSPVDTRTTLDLNRPRYKCDFETLEMDLLGVETRLEAYLGRMRGLRSDAERAIRNLEYVRETILAETVREGLKKVKTEIAAAAKVLRDCTTCRWQVATVRAGENELQWLRTVRPQLVEPLNQMVDCAVQMMSTQMSLLMNGIKQAEERIVSTTQLPGILYLKVPQDERKRLCKYLFSRETCPHKDCALFVYRLFTAKQTKGEGRAWTSDEHELLHLIRETSLELIERLQREQTKNALIRAIHALFDALEDDIANYRNGPLL